MRARLLAAMMAFSFAFVIGAGAPANAGPQEPVVGVSCAYANVVSGRMQLQPLAIDDVELVGAVVERSRDGSRWWWRGRVDISGVFYDSLPNGSVVEYRVRGILPDGTLTDPSPCGTVDLDGSIAPPEACTTSVDAFGNVTVRVEQNEQLYQRFVLYRSVDGGPTYWRAARDAWVWDAYVTDSMADGTSAQYEVVAVAVDGTRSTPVPCGPPVSHQVIPPSAPVCDVVPNGTATFDARAGAADDEVDVAVFRSIDGGRQWWRGRQGDAPAWSDETVEPGRYYEYFVEAVGHTGLHSERVFCASFRFTEWSDSSRAGL